MSIDLISFIYSTSVSCSLLFLGALIYLHLHTVFSLISMLSSSHEKNALIFLKQLLRVAMDISSPISDLLSILDFKYPLSATKLYFPLSLVNVIYSSTTFLFTFLMSLISFSSSKYLAKRINVWLYDLIVFQISSYSCKNQDNLELSLLLFLIFQKFQA